MIPWGVTEEMSSWRWFRDATRQDAARFAESFRARIDRKAVETPEGMIPVTLSLGVVALENLRDVKSETLVRVADAALYRAKIAGRNRVALATAQDVEKEVSKHLQECERAGA